ncbi:hypothetical protein [Xanthomonas cannabis]|uniref:hypothetical protein n=1 Tax=Xanthomonas cannabis TaxID=1885674 RepID=UPI00141B016C|nr:hypothetical protein [Xanthomonas cannabis]NIK00984.1 hypothetical protein [Xanthomonas cannabis]
MYRSIVSASLPWAIAAAGIAAADVPSGKCRLQARCRPLRGGFEEARTARYLTLPHLHPALRATFSRGEKANAAHSRHCLRRLIGGTPNPHQQWIDPHVEPRRSDLDAARQQPRRRAPESVTPQIARTLFTAFEHQQWIDPHVEPRRSDLDAAREQPRRRAPESVPSQIARRFYLPRSSTSNGSIRTSNRAAVMSMPRESNRAAARRRACRLG